MKEGHDYLKDIAEMRNMMERSTKFLSLSGLAGVMAGLYALAGAFIAWKVLGFNTFRMIEPGIALSNLPVEVRNLILLAIVVIILAAGTAILLSAQKAGRRGEKLWNPVAKIMLAQLAVPLFTGGLLILILLANGFIGLLAPMTMVFYGLALFNAGSLTFGEIKTLGLIQIALGLAGTLFVDYGLACWALGFGIGHIVYGIYLHMRYDQ